MCYDRKMQELRWPKALDQETRASLAKTAEAAVHASEKEGVYTEPKAEMYQMEYKPEEAIDTQKVAKNLIVANSEPYTLAQQKWVNQQKLLQDIDELENNLNELKQRITSGSRRQFQSDEPIDPFLVLEGIEMTEANLAILKEKAKQGQNAQEEFKAERVKIEALCKIYDPDKPADN